MIDELQGHEVQMNILKHFTANALRVKSFPFQRELSMEAYLIENPQILSLEETEDEIPEVINDELTIPSGRKSKRGDGRIDLLVKYSSSETLGVIELKKGEIGKNNIDQLQDYLNQRDHIWEEAKDDCSEFKSTNWVGILVGSKINSDLRHYIEAGGGIEVNGEVVPLIALTIQRFRGEDGQVFVVTDTYIRESKKDYTKYIFKDEEYSKRGLVLRVIQELVKDNPQITFEEIKGKFPSDSAQRWEIVIMKKDVDGKTESRYFTDSSQVIKLRDTKVVVCNQWSTTSIEPFIKRAKVLGYKIEEKVSE